MNFELYQWLIPLLGGLYIARILYQYYRKKRSMRSTLIWLIFWVTVIILAVVPNEFSFKIAHLLGFKSNVNAVIFVALGLLFLFIYYLSTTLETLENRLTELTRKIALEKQEKEDESK